MRFAFTALPSAAACSSSHEFALAAHAQDSGAVQSKAVIVKFEDPGGSALACSSALQVQKLSDGDAEETTRSLYNRNVSSSKLLNDKTLEPLPEPKRMAGDIVSFKRRV